MILEKLKYIRNKGRSNEWIIVDKNDEAVHFGNTNLIVGKNAVGKSRTLAEVGDIAALLSLVKDISALRTSNWESELFFREGDNIYVYIISVHNGCIVDESLYINDRLKVDRRSNKIYSETSHDYDVIDIDDKTLVISLKDKSLEYPYLSELFEWGNAAKAFTFTNQHDKNSLLKKEEIESVKEIRHDNINTILLFHKGKELFGDDFIRTIILDMKRLDYEINNISLESTPNGIGISVLEDKLSDPIIQTDLSQGMYRALSFIIELNFALASRASVCLLIDDLGEGLDFSRSKFLIDLLIHKINNTDIQIFITTNDRYVMNSIPIKYWSVLKRKAKASIFYNYYNSKEIFDDFKYTGLNNFDFLATDFYLHGFENEPDDV